MFKKMFSNKVPSNSRRITMIEVLVLSLKRGEMLIHKKRDQLVVSEVRNMRMTVFLGLIVTKVVAMVAIW